MTKTIDVILPGLFQLPLAEFDDDFLADGLASLNQILRFAHKKANHLQDFDAIFADSLGLAEYGQLPLASAFAEKGQSPSQNLLCQATHLKPDMRNAFVVPLDQSSKTQEDISNIIKGLSSLFKDDCTITELPDGLYFMRLKHCQAPAHFPPILSVIGRKVDPYIKQSRQALPWYRLINEMQMFMHSHEVNQKRLLEGLLPINSLWCWGAGEYVMPSNPEIQCYCDDSVLGAYLSRGGVRLQALSELSESEFARNNICIDLSLLQALKMPGSEGLPLLLDRLEANLFKPLIKGVDSGQLQLRLRAGYDHDFQLSRYSSFQRWRKPNNLMLLST